MKTETIIFLLLFCLVLSCTTPKNLSYLGVNKNSNSEDYFTMIIPDYKIQSRDILYITIKAMTLDGSINDFLLPARTNPSGSMLQSESGSFIYGYDVNNEGNITLPVLGNIKVGGLTLEEARSKVEIEANKIFINSTVECKLLSFKFTVIGEVKMPGTYINYNNYLTVLEAIGRAGGIGDFGNRETVLVVRPVVNGSKTFRININDKSILSSEAYFLLPNDVIIVEPLRHKIFNMNLPTFAFIVTTITSTITTTLLLINYLK